MAQAKYSFLDGGERRAVAHFADDISKRKDGGDTVRDFRNILLGFTSGGWFLIFGILINVIFSTSPM